ncbi:MAG: PEP-CTERM sorting domain-containing protein [Opitutales bacterium]|nr:PEP-CTERM sorting domain-containing protein [Opitutales bacterium]
MKILNAIAATCAALVLASTASANNVTLTFTGTSDTTNFGYTIGQNVSFSIVLNDAVMTTGSFDDSVATFKDENTYNDADIYSSISGTGLTGVWERPSQFASDPYSRLLYNSSGVLEVYAGTGKDYGIGLSASGTELSTVRFYVTLTGFAPTDLDSTANPCTFLSSYVGTYDVSDSHYAYFDNYDNLFTISQVQISAVPEPSQAAAFAGLGVLALAAWRRRRARA